jgi:putative endonuclease
MTSPDRQYAEGRGRRAETLASLLLRCKFYRVLGRWVRTPLGEIDLIARAPNGELCFIEVKARMLEESAVESLTSRQRERIVASPSFTSGPDPDYATKVSDSTPYWSLPAACRATSRTPGDRIDVHATRVV